MAEKKKWFEVDIPLLKTKVKLIAYSIEELNKRTIKLDLTRQLRGKSIEAIIQVEADNEKAIGSVTRLNLLGFFIRRMMRANIDYVEDSFSCDCIDSVLRIKPFLITRKKVTRAVRKALRENAKKYIEEYAKDRGTEDIFYDIISNKLQKSLSLKLKKVYPLALCEIRQAYIEKLKEGVKIEKLTTKKAAPEQLEEEQEKSQIEEIEEELRKKEKAEEKTE